MRRLAIVRRLVESWEGTVTAASREGGGTVVRIRLLMADRETRPAAEGAPSRTASIIAAIASPQTSGVTF